MGVKTTKRALVNENCDIVVIWRTEKGGEGRRGARPYLLSESSVAAVRGERPARGLAPSSFSLSLSLTLSLRLPHAHTPRTSSAGRRQQALLVL